MRINARLVILLIWLVGYGCKTDPARQETDFRISDTAAVHRIEIYAPDGEKQNLERRPDGWWINGKFPVRPDAIANIFRILPGVQVMFYPPDAAIAQMMQAIRGHGVRLVFLDRGGDPIKSYRIGGMTNDERGTYALMDGFERPYVVHVPGFEGSLANRFTMPVEDWRDRMLFRHRPESLTGLKLSYPDHPEEGFEIKRMEGRFELYDYGGRLMQTGESGIRAYLDVFSGIGVESIENDFEGIPEVLASRPHAVLDLNFLPDSSRTLKFFPIYVEGQQEVERLFVYDGQDFFLAQTRILQKIFRSSAAF
ncbi:MAG TPA: DUF4340 domain-containing protein [Saprospiraceae bacterium]|nr:DUF4340 domain-containing protein [Saprospiraceae bacterium]HNT22169.1 DUF4340 domain-containing protein [Saprospiraceae bacterium]